MTQSALRTSIDRFREKNPRIQSTAAIINSALITIPVVGLCATGMDIATAASSAELFNSPEALVNRAATWSMALGAPIAAASGFIQNIIRKRKIVELFRHDKSLIVELAPLLSAANDTFGLFRMSRERLAKMIHELRNTDPAKSDHKALLITLVTRAAARIDDIEEHNNDQELLSRYEDIL